MLMQKKLILLLITIGALLLAVNTHAATLTTSIDRTAITINDTLLLTITLDKQGADEIDFAALELQFDILQRQQSSQTSIVNGRISSRTQWTLVIAPKETGSLLIPSLSANGAFSDAIKITVDDNNSSNGSQSNSQSNSQINNQNNLQNNAPTTNGNNQTNTNGEVFLRAIVNKNSVYVQEQIILRLQLHYRISLTDYEASEFIISDSAQELIDKKNFKTAINGVTYNVLEHVYALHPQTSGTLTIPQQLWQVEKPSNRFGRIQSPFLRVTSQPLAINVKPISSQSTADYWLPASKINFTQQWEQSTISANVGEPLSYQLTITADGLGHSQLPNISLDTNTNTDFTIYSDKADTKNQLGTQGIVGTRLINYAVIPKNTGTFTLPPISLRWWNINTDKEEVITLESQKIVVASTLLDQQNTIPAVSAVENTSTSDSPTTPSTTLRLWQFSTGVFFVLWLIFFYLWCRRRNGYHDAGKSPRQSGSFNNIAKNKRSLKIIYSDIESAVENKQYVALKALLLEWARHKTKENVTNSDEFYRYFTELSEVMSTIDKQLYSPNSIVVWDFAELLNLLKQQKAPKTETANNAELEGLYH
jgi:hypothetical protein